MQSPAPEAAVRQLLSFQMGGLACAVDLAQVREIVRYELVTRVPRVAACVKGVINLRGSVVPVIDLAVAFGLPESPVTAETCLLMVEMAVGSERAVVGLLAASVNQVLEVGAEDLEPAPPFGTPIPASSLLGLARSPAGIALVLDVHRLIGEGVAMEKTA